MVAKIGIKTLVSEQLPAFVAEENPVFVSFMEAYFEFIEQRNMPMNSLRSMKDFIDSDVMLGDFISEFFEEMKSLPRNLVADKQLLAKHIYELYQAKGTVKSYELLFRIMFGESCSVYLPSDDMIRTSGGVWARTTIIRTRFVQGNPFDLTGHKIEQRNSNGTITASAIVESVVAVENSSQTFYDISISQSSILGTFNSLSEVTYSDISVIPVDVPRVSGFNARGGGYVPGQRINLIETSGEGCEIFILSTLPGKIEGGIVLDGGIGYSVGDTLPINGDGNGAIVKVKSVTDEGTITAVSVWKGGNGYYTYPTITDFDSLTETNRCLIVCYGDDIGRIGECSYTSLGFGYSGIPVGIFDTNVVINDTTADFINGESITIISDRPTFENYDDIICENGDSIISEITEDEQSNLNVVSVSGNTATISGVMEDIYFQLEDEGGSIVMESGEFVELESSSQVFSNRTFVGSVSGAKARIVYANPASVKMDMSSVSVTSGRYINDDSKISEFSKRIQDSYYYQDFSYVIKSGISIEKYRNAIQKLLHPVGTVMFGSISIDAKMDVSMSVVSSLVKISRDILSRYFMSRITVAESFVGIRHASSAESSSHRSYHWLEHAKFAIGANPGGTSGTTKTVQTYSLSDENFLRDQSCCIANFENLTFNELYEFEDPVDISTHISTESTDSITTGDSIPLITENSAIIESANYSIRNKNRMWAWPSYILPPIFEWDDSYMWDDGMDWIEP